MSLLKAAQELDSNFRSDAHAFEGERIVKVLNCIEFALGKSGVRDECL